MNDSTDFLNRLADAKCPTKYKLEGRFRIQTQGTKLQTDD